MAPTLEPRRASGFRVSLLNRPLAFVNDTKQDSKGNLLLGSERTWVNATTLAEEFVGFGSGLVKFFQGEGLAYKIIGLAFEIIGWLFMTYAIYAFEERQRGILNQQKAKYFNPWHIVLFSIGMAALLLTTTFLSVVFTPTTIIEIADD